ncbi:uncharacterized protein [Aristolochia californica]|uniref:uncharacterized protein n=1 Tax=Aristolochia californica TaxID=171875 RepID=UPI0035D701B3
MENLNLDWEEFKELCTIWFGPPAQSNSLGDLVLLHHTFTVKQYQKAFQEKLAIASKMVRVDQQVGFFTADLTESLQLEVELLAPSNLARRSSAPTNPFPAPKPSPSQPKLFWLEVEEDEEEAPESAKPVEEEKEPEISLHTIIGLQSTKTMQLGAFVNEQPLLSLIDSRSTHNFISFNTAQQLQLPLQPRPVTSVSVASGDKLPSYGIHKAVMFSIEGHQFEAEFLIIPLAGFDMVLGIKWLQMLGQIL